MNALAPLTTRRARSTVTRGASSNGQRALNTRDLLDLKTRKRKGNMGQDNHLETKLEQTAALRHHFKAVTTMSPSQFQKQLRLQEARRLLLGKDLDAASAAYRVGYQDASHFNREYKSLFGVSPIRDVQRLQEGA